MSTLNEPVWDSQVEGGEDGEWPRQGGVIMRVVTHCSTTAGRKEQEHGEGEEHEQEHEEHYWQGVEWEACEKEYEEECGECEEGTEQTSLQTEWIKIFQSPTFATLKNFNDKPEGSTYIVFIWNVLQS